MFWGSLCRQLLPCLLACGACRPSAFDGLAAGEVSVSEAGATRDASPSLWHDAGADTDAETDPEDDGAVDVGDDAGEADAAGPDAAGPCLDTTRDPHNCGTCGFACGADFALASCINSRCSRVCDATHDDCNRDLASGSEGDGCETRIENDSMNCGGCDVRCVASGYGYVSCREQACIEHAIKLRDVQAGSLHGGLGGNVFPERQLCGPNEVLVGVSGVGSTIAYSLSVHCARLALSRTATGYALKIVPTGMSKAVGGLIGPEPPPPFTRACPADSIVTAVSGATWLWPGQSMDSVRQISLRCATPTIDAERRLMLSAPLAPLTIGDANDATAKPFSDSCGPDGAVVGFTGRSGAYLDALATHCGTLAIEEEPAISSTAEE
jgi:hypothetical protein